MIDPILIFGLARSGTSWLARIFDSHPNVIYRHEPDMVYRDNRLPVFSSVSEITANIGLAREYLDQLSRVHTLKATGGLPVFAKRYRSASAKVLRTSIILALRGVEAVVGERQWLSRLSVPDLVAERQRREARLVIKSVTSLAFIRLFAEACPQSRIIIIMRHPCGQISSVLRGIELGKFPEFDRVEGTSGARKPIMLGVKQASAATLTHQLAREWALWNQRIVDSVSGLSHVRVLKYEDLVVDPLRVARDLFAFTDLSWNRQTENFIIKSSTSNRSNRYYGVQRNSSQVVDRWRASLSIDDQARIASVVRRVAIGRWYVGPPEDDRSDVDLACALNETCALNDTSES